MTLHMIHYCAMKENRYLDGHININLDHKEWYRNLKREIIDFFKLDIEAEELTLLNVSVLKKLD